MNGQFTPTAYVVILESQAQTQAGRIDTRIRAAGDRIGECDKGQSTGAAENPPI